MAPSSTSIETAPAAHVVSKEPISKTILADRTSPGNPVLQPLHYNGSLDEYESFDITNVIGREYPKADLLDILKSDEKIRDLAITVSQRGVVFFRNQDISVEDQKTLGQKLGELTGKPESSKVCRGQNNP